VKKAVIAGEAVARGQSEDSELRKCLFSCHLASASVIDIASLRIRPTSIGRETRGRRHDVLPRRIPHSLVSIPPRHVHSQRGKWWSPCSMSHGKDLKCIHRSISSGSSPQRAWAHRVPAPSSCPDQDAQHDCIRWFYWSRGCSVQTSSLKLGKARHSAVEAGRLHVEAKRQTVIHVRLVH